MAAWLHTKRFGTVFCKGNTFNCEVLGKAIVFILKPDEKEGERAEAGATGDAFIRCFEDFQCTQATDTHSRLNNRHETDQTSSYSGLGVSLNIGLPHAQANLRAAPSMHKDAPGLGPLWRGSP